MVVRVEGYNAFVEVVLVTIKHEPKVPTGAYLEANKMLHLNAPILITCGSFLVA